MHELTHILGFSSLSYELYPTGNPYVTNEDTGNYLSTSKLNAEVAAHFGCNSTKGLRLEDMDYSHWERKILGTEYMTTSNIKSSYLSRFTLSLLDSTGWYPYVDYSYADRILWGKGKGCDFLNVDNCDSTPEFCPSTGFSCDFDGTGIGSCLTDSLSNDCSVVNYYTNTICTDPAYPTKNLNKKMGASEVGGWNSRCFNSDFRLPGLKATSLNYRCYQMKCSEDGKIYIQIGNSVLKCQTPGQIIKAPYFLTGQLTCPSSFDNYCKNKKICINNCNLNGVCLSGKCLCTGSLTLQKNCPDIDLSTVQMGDTGGFAYAKTETIGTLGDKSKKCFENTVFDQEFGDCISCLDRFGCAKCTVAGCNTCPNGLPPNPKTGSCL